LPTVIAAFSNRRRSQAITDMHSAAFMGVSAAVHFLSLLFSVTNSLITIILLHHHRNPLFSTKKGQNQFQVMKFFNFHPSISPSHHLINPFNFTCFQFQVLSISPSHHLINPLFSISILQFDLTIGFVLLCR
jgi:hypothetical protein